MSHSPPSSRIRMPEPRPLIAGLIIALVGVAMVATRQTQWRDLGWALVVIGGLAAGWWTSEALRVLRVRRDLDREAARKAALQTTRRQKDEEERTRREADKKAREEQAARLREQRLEESRKRKDAEEAAARVRAENEARIEAEVARLKALDPDELATEIAAKLAGRGYRLAATESESGALKFDREGGAGQAVCRIVTGRSTRDSHVRDLEAWRRDAGADEAFLVCLTGFAPDAIRAAQGKPITLVEAHLLASWNDETAATVAET